MSTLVPPDDLPGGGSDSSSSGPVPPEDMPESVQGASPVPEGDLPQTNEQKYGTTEQQVKTGLEGAAQGVIGPAAPYIETHLLGVKPEDIAGRAETNPWTHGVSEAATLGAGFLTGTGEAGLLAKAGEAAAKSAELGKYGSIAIKGLVEGLGLGGSDEASKYILGQTDPESPVSSALLHIGASGLMGGAVGPLVESATSSLAKIAEAKMGTRAANFLAQFGSRAKTISEVGGDPVSAITDELTHLHNAVTGAVDDVRGVGGLKSQVVDKLAQDVSPEQISSHVDNISNMIEKAPQALKDDSVIGDALQAWRSKVTPEIDPITLQPKFTPSASDVFKATDELKRQMWESAQFNKAFISRADLPFVNGAKSLGSALKDSLEDKSTWGKLGQFQADTNKLTSDMIPKLKDFNSSFSTKQEGVPSVDSAKVNTYYNQQGKPSVGFKPARLSNFVKSGQDFLDQVADMHNSLGLESPIAPVPLNAVKSTLGETTPGSKAADSLYKWAASKTGGSMAGAGIGAAEGYRHGGVRGAITGGVGGYFMPELGLALGKSLTKYSGPAAVKALSTGNALGIFKIIQHAESVGRGAARLSGGIDSLFKSGGQQAVSTAVSDNDRQKIKDYVEQNGMGKQLDAQAKKPPEPDPIQKFAEGGDVLDNPKNDVPQPAILSGADSMAKTYPDQASMMEQTKGRVANYLNSIRPLPNVGALPYDKQIKDKAKEKSYENAVDLAAEPISILNKIKAGTIDPETMKHFTSMYPEIHSHMSKKITERVAQSKIDEEMPQYHVRQGLSYFLGSPLDSTLTQQNMQAAQSVFLKQAAQPQPQMPMKKKSGTAPLTKLSDQYQTSTQASEARQRNG